MTESGEQPRGQGQGPDPREIREKVIWRAAVVMLLAITGWLFYVAFDALEQVEELEAQLEACECD